VISFNHKRPFEEEQRYIVSPLYLKVYDKRWYLIAFNHSESVYDHFDLTMFVSKIKPTNASFIKNPKPLKEIYKDVIGISLTWEEFTEPLDIILRFKIPQHEYAMNPPLHDSMSKPFNNNGKTVDIQFCLVPTYEFIMKVIGWNRYVELVAPSGASTESKNAITILRKKIKTLLEESVKKYGTRL